MKAKVFLQRGYRGFADENLRGFDVYLSEMLSKALGQMARETQGHPEGFKNWLWM